jgi:hypothetical protein
MFRSKFVVPALSVVCLLASQAVIPAVASASTLRVRPNTSVQPLIHSKSKMVDMNIANNTGSVLEVKVGDTPMKIETGQTVKVSAPAGTKIIVTASSNHEVGSTLAELTTDLAGATIRVN